MIAAPMPEPTIRYAPPVRDAIVAAYYQRATALADAARARAQNAYAIASALSGSFVAAGLLLSRERATPAVTVLGLTATAGWALAAILYARAVAAPVPHPPGSQPDADAFVSAVIQEVSTEQSVVDRRLRQASGVALLAVVLSLLTVSVRLVPVAWERTRGEVVLSDEGARAVRSLCPAAGATLTGEIELATPTADYVTVRPDGCRGRSLRVPRDQVTAVSVRRS
jgi:hypothetical protein